MTVEDAVRQSLPIKMSASEAVRASRLLSFDFVTSHKNVAEDEYDSVRNVFALQENLKDILIQRCLDIPYRRVVPITHGYIPESYSVGEPEFSEESSSFEFYSMSTTSSNYGYDIAYELAHTPDVDIVALASTVSMYGGVENLHDMEEDEALEWFDNNEDYFLEEFSEDEFDDIKLNYLDALENIQKGNTDDFVDRLSNHMKDFKTVFSKEEIEQHLEELLANVVGNEFEGDRYLYENTKIPLFYLHQENFPKTAESEALLCAIEYFLYPKEVCAPGTADFGFVNENHLVLMVCFGGFREEGYLVEEGHLRPWWKLSKHIIDVLLPIVLKQKLN